MFWTDYEDGPKALVFESITSEEVAELIPRRLLSKLPSPGEYRNFSLAIQRAVIKRLHKSTHSSLRKGDGNILGEHPFSLFFFFFFSFGFKQRGPVKGVGDMLMHNPFPTTSAPFQRQILNVEYWSLISDSTSLALCLMLRETLRHVTTHSIDDTCRYHPLGMSPCSRFRGVGFVLYPTLYLLGVSSHASSCGSCTRMYSMFCTHLRIPPRALHH
jgi:hypothetical protein